jgi:hypothetical protein
VSLSFSFSFSSFVTQPTSRKMLGNGGGKKVLLAFISGEQQQQQQKFQIKLLFFSLTHTHTFIRI